MAEQYGVSRDVIRRAKEELAGKGWLIVLQGRGRFVARTVPGDSDRPSSWHVLVTRDLPRAGKVVPAFANNHIRRYVLLLGVVN